MSREVEKGILLKLGGQGDSSMSIVKSSGGSEVRWNAIWTWRLSFRVYCVVRQLAEDDLCQTKSTLIPLIFFRCVFPLQTVIVLLLQILTSDHHGQFALHIYTGMSNSTAAPARSNGESSLATFDYASKIMLSAQYTDMRQVFMAL